MLEDYSPRRAKRTEPINKEIAEARSTTTDTEIKLSEYYKKELDHERKRRTEEDAKQQTQIDDLVVTRADCYKEVERLRDFAVELERQMKAVLLEKKGLEGTVAALQVRFSALHLQVEGVTRPVLDAAREAKLDPAPPDPRTTDEA